MEFETQQEVEAAIDQHYRTICDLKFRWNMFSPINRRFPPEVLEEVFLYYAMGMCPSVYEFLHRSSPGAYAWIRIGHVCRFWREIVLQLPRMWGHITVGPYTMPECVDEMLRRSRQTSLVVQAYLPAHTLSGFTSLSVVLAQLHRTRNLNLTVSAAHLVEHFGTLGGTAPKLRNFTLTEPFGLGSPVDPPFPTQATHLNRLVISGHPLTKVQQMFCPSLRHLSLSSMNIDSLEILYQSLVKMPSIRTLELQFLDMHNTISMFSDENVALPHLRSMRLSAGGNSAALCARFLRRVTFPGDTSISCIGFQDVVGYFRGSSTAFVSAIADKLNGVGTIGTPLPLKSLSLRSSKSGETALVMQGWTSEHTVDSLHRGIRKHCQFENQWSARCAIIQVVELCSAIKLSEVTSFYISDHPLARFEIYDWVKAFMQMQKLRTLDVRSFAARTLPAVLMLQHDGPNSMPGGPSGAKPILQWKPMFPSLQRLVLRGVHFKEYYRQKDELTFLAVLGEALRKRKSRGLQLPQLVIQDAVNFTASDENRLALLVKHLEWDGEETILDDREEDEKNCTDEEEFDSDG
ncbi:hypothetical protein PHLCEN_2v11829 [Hermanssonia centrifuga]|uniref:Uncharacterized protein n=1 Tax=Hermanssonia centrifuga TaxID=98765 RepID=A0A2R6NIM5_9APHY|nr:hypothetical protein PHLCEN_2v11829 [Hermanssonia centrifuga]